MKNYKHFLLESKKDSDIIPIQILMRVHGVCVKSEDFSKKAMKIIYDKFVRAVIIDDKENYNPDVSDNRKHKIDYSKPILNYTTIDTKLLKNKNATIFNKFEDGIISGDKKIFQEELGEECDCIPNAVYSLKDIEKLELPIIAKPKGGKSAQGIEKFDTYEDAKSSKLEFDVWCECKDLDREFRVFIMNGEIIQLVERITNTNNDMGVGKKDADESIDFIYIDQDMNKTPHLKQIKDIQKQLESKVNLDFYVIDLMLDKDGDMWVPEINSAPALNPSDFRGLYKSWLKMAYNKEVPSDLDKELETIATSHRESMKKRYPKEYKSSLNPI